MTPDTTTNTIDDAFFSKHPELHHSSAFLSILQLSFKKPAKYNFVPSNRNLHILNVFQSFIHTNSYIAIVTLSTPMRTFSEVTEPDFYHTYGTYIKSLASFDITKDSLGINSSIPPAFDNCTDLFSHMSVIWRNTSLDNESLSSALIPLLLYRVLETSKSQITMSFNKRIQGIRGCGSIDYAIEAINPLLTQICIARAAPSTFKDEISRTLMKMDTILHLHEDTQSSSAQKRLFGIVTDVYRWYFLECTIDPDLVTNTTSFRVSEPITIDHNSNNWKLETTIVLEHIYLLLTCSKQ